MHKVYSQCYSKFIRLQFLCHTYHLHPEPANKSRDKATLASHAFCDASQPI